MSGKAESSIPEKTDIYHRHDIFSVKANGAACWHVHGDRDGHGDPHELGRMGYAGIDRTASSVGTKSFIGWEAGVKECGSEKEGGYHFGSWLEARETLKTRATRSIVALLY